MSNGQTGKTEGFYCENAVKSEIEKLMEVEDRNWSRMINVLLKRGIEATKRSASQAQAQ